MPLDQNPHQRAPLFGCVVGAFQCMHEDFLCHKCESFAYLHNRQDQNEFHLKMWFIFAKSASSVSRSQTHLTKRSSSVYTTIFVRRKDKTNYLSNQTRTEYYHSRNSCDLTPLEYYLWDAVKDMCYVDKPETIDALKNNIYEAIGEIQMHTIDNVL